MSFIIRLLDSKHLSKNVKENTILSNGKTSGLIKKKPKNGNFHKPYELIPLLNKGKIINHYYIN